MLRNLPAPHEYYRPTHARALQRQAARWQWLLDLWPFVLLLACGAVLLLAFRSAFGVVGSLCLGIGVVFPALLWWRARLDAHVGRLNQEAATLDGEHQSRHG